MSLSDAPILYFLGFRVSVFFIIIDEHLLSLFVLDHKAHELIFLKLPGEFLISHIRKVLVVYFTLQEKCLFIVHYRIIAGFVVHLEDYPS